MTTQEILAAARSAKSALALADTDTRNRALLGMAQALCTPENQQAILVANAADLEAARSLAGQRAELQEKDETIARLKEEGSAQALKAELEAAYEEGVERNG